MPLTATLRFGIVSAREADVAARRFIEEMRVEGRHLRLHPRSFGGWKEYSKFFVSEGRIWTVRRGPFKAVLKLLKFDSPPEGLFLVSSWRSSPYFPLRPELGMEGVRFLRISRDIAEPAIIPCANHVATCCAEGFPGALLIPEVQAPPEERELAARNGREPRTPRWKTARGVRWDTCPTSPYLW